MMMKWKTKLTSCETKQVLLQGGFEFLVVGGLDDVSHACNPISLSQWSSWLLIKKIKLGQNAIRQVRVKTLQFLECEYDKL
jgi:hypothetical protein